MSFAETRALMPFIAPFIGLFGVLLGSCLNAYWQSRKSDNEKREADISYKSEVRAHMSRVEGELEYVREELSGQRELKGRVDTFIESTDNRLERIEQCLQK